MNALSARFLAFISCLLVTLTGFSGAWQSDNGDGTFTNPVLNSDFPDPDIIRVGTDFYMVSSTFVQSPGINLLQSKDLVNWHLVGQVASEVGTTDPFNMINGTAYEGGYWAPSIRHRNGTFYVVVNPTFANARVYYATNPAGPWQFHQLDRPAYDPGFFIDDDGTGYIACDGGSLTLLKLNANYSQVVSQTDNFLNAGGEGSHMLKHNGWYYVFNANPGVWPFQLRCSRATSLTGPWETRVALNAITGGHQGAILDLADGNWFGFVHQDSGAVGRMVHRLQRHARRIKRRDVLELRHHHRHPGTGRHVPRSDRPAGPPPPSPVLNPFPQRGNTRGRRGMMGFFHDGPIHFPQIDTKILLLRSVMMSSSPRFPLP